jgi:hypothetical protein
MNSCSRTFNAMMETLLPQNRLIYPLADSPSSVDRRRYHITGPTCDSQDTMCFGVWLSNRLLPGDQVHISSAGAYTTRDASALNGFGPRPPKASPDRRAGRALDARGRGVGSVRRGPLPGSVQLNTSACRPTWSRSDTGDDGRRRTNLAKRYGRLAVIFRSVIACSAARWPPQC